MNNFDVLPSTLADRDPQETSEWIESLESVFAVDGPRRVHFLLDTVMRKAREHASTLPALTNTDYVNSIPTSLEPEYPGDYEMEKRIRRIIRWNAVAMVARANKEYDGIGGHLSSYASAAHLYEVGFNHFFRGREAPGGGDQVFIQGHSAPGIYARAFLEGRLTQEQLDHFRRETSGKGLSSYPHPWLMPDFWQFPTVSMGLGGLAAIYQARFAKYLHNRGLKDTTNNRVWCFMGDGECDEPESLGALTIAAREGLNNLVFVVNCNLQRLDGPVRGNGKVIQELEGVFRGAGWNVIKVVWGHQWDPIFAKDIDGVLVQRLNQLVDGEYQRYTSETGAYIRQHLTQNDPKLLEIFSELSDEDLRTIRRGGHSLSKLHAAYHWACQSERAPTVILAKTVKGFALGEGFEGSNVTHQMKKVGPAQLKKFRDALEVPVSDEELEHIPYYHPGPKSPEVEYLQARRAALGGPLPRRKNRNPEVKTPPVSVFEELHQPSKVNADPSTTVAFVRLLRKLLRDKEFGKFVVPIVPDEGRTFGMESLFKEIGIYAADGQKYEPADAKMLLGYVEKKDGQLLEEGITEAGSMASFTAAGTSYATHGVPTVPFYIFYSMFGFQRVQDQIWAFGDARGRGFLFGATAGRTTLNGEGLQHEDGHSHLQAMAVPNCLAYDPAYAYEIAVIVRDGLTRMLDKNQDVFYYLTLYNENYAMPALPSGIEDGILRGLYKLKDADAGKAKLTANIFGSGSIINSALEAQSILADYGVAATVWSATSYQQLYRDARKIERLNRMQPDKKPGVPYITETLEGASGPVVMTSDWVSELPSLLARFIPNRVVPLGTNGFGRSDTREALRRHFEIDAASTVIATLHALMLDGKVTAKVVKDAMKKLDFDPSKVDSAEA
ncbi:MAG: pyruvate dehydrogenase (acetyl-transferring), homodimeric type [Myxococcota bacterium]